MCTARLPARAVARRRARLLQRRGPAAAQDLCAASRRQAGSAMRVHAGRWVVGRAAGARRGRAVEGCRGVGGLAGAQHAMRVHAGRWVVGRAAGAHHKFVHNVSPIVVHTKRTSPSLNPTKQMRSFAKTVVSTQHIQFLSC
eukprot:49102-Chlamydomonas_euryale.AAC.2